MSKLLILFVEDDPGVRLLLSDALEEAGFQVHAEASGRQALAALEADSERFGLAVTDVDLGLGPSGWEVAWRARQLQPGLPVVYMTGASADAWAAEGVPGSVLLTKPFAPAQLITAVAELLNRAPTLDGR